MYTDLKREKTPLTGLIPNLADFDLVSTCLFLMCAICVAISLIKERKKYHKINLLIYVIDGKKDQTKQTKNENKTSSYHLISF